MSKPIPKARTASRGVRFGSTDGQSDLPSPMNVKVEPLPHLIDESFEEAAFLWSRWEADLSSISRNLDEVWTWTEDRLGGALDGVALASNAILERLSGAALADGNLH